MAHDQGDALRRELIRRALLLDRCKRGPDAAQMAYRAAAADPIVFCETWCWTFDPRRRQQPYLPFALWPRQREYLAWLRERYDRQEEWLVEKSRDVGITWLNLMFCVWGWLFEEGFAAAFGANKGQTVDQIGNPRSILEKGRILIRRLPDFLKPPGLSIGDHLMHMRFVNPANGNTIVGEAGDDMGRGGRASIYIVDEAAHVERDESVDAATLANADCRGWVSSVHGMGNLFARKRHGGEIPVFTFHYRDDPRKTAEWIRATKAKTDPWIWAAEYEIDYGASVEGLLCPKPWIDAAIELGRRLPWPRSAAAIAGLDVGAGRAASVCIVRDGPLVLAPEAWGNPDTVHTAQTALAHARARGAAQLFYDAPGVGKGVGDFLKHRPEDDPLRVRGINTGLPPSRNRIWHDGRTSAEWFVNLKAEAWWQIRQRLKASAEHLAWLAGDAEGIEHPLEECLLLPHDPKLAVELNLPRWFRDPAGRIKVESKEMLAQRNIPSPDRADALALTFCTPPQETWRPDDVEFGPEPAMARADW